MKLVLSTHAQIRLSERGIDFSKIKKVIKEPDKSKAEFGGRIKATKLIEGRNITVIYYKNKNEFVIITAI